MILVDTSVWIDHLRSGEPALASALDAGRVLAHPFVQGELACGNLRQREEIIRLLQELPQAVVASHAEVLDFIERHGLMGRGIGYIDVHLVAATALTEGARLWARDRRLTEVAAQLQLASEHA